MSKPYAIRCKFICSSALLPEDLTLLKICLMKQGDVILVFRQYTALLLKEEGYVWHGVNIASGCVPCLALLKLLLFKDLLLFLLPALHFLCKSLF